MDVRRVRISQRRPRRPSSRAASRWRRRMRVAMRPAAISTEPKDLLICVQCANGLP